MTWLYMEFVLIFSPADIRAKLGRTATEQLLTLALLSRRMKVKEILTYLKTFGFNNYFPCF